jgi:hypothetical protein
LNRVFKWLSLFVDQIHSFDECASYPIVLSVILIGQNVYLIARRIVRMPSDSSYRVAVIIVRIDDSVCDLSIRQPPFDRDNLSQAVVLIVGKAEEKIDVTLTLINAGTDHKLRQAIQIDTLRWSLRVVDKKGVVIEQQKTRWAVGLCGIIELYDNRLLPLASRDHTFSYQLPKDLDGLKLKTRVRYHIQSEKQHQMLINKFGLTARSLSLHSLRAGSSSHRGSCPGLR